MKRLNIKLDDDIHAHLKTRAAASRQTIQSFVWGAILTAIAPLPLKKYRKAKP
jgi:uncharacterized protein (DUF1778 family)